ncbi:MAG TPA: DUF1287 domain-containing protein [Abditibacteriaceae bacterium]|jgi:hypothetical protein
MKQKRHLEIVVAIGIVCIAGAVWYSLDSTRPPRPAREMTPLKPGSAVAAKILAGAKSQQGTHYNQSYVQISYPGGDLRSDRGACTDVVVRALRKTGIDLQKLIHEDMARGFRSYPQNWGLSKPDTNIDHRRVPNQMTFLRRYGQTLTTSVSGSALKSWQPGDVVYWDTGSRLHTGIVSDRRNGWGHPFVIHNGWMCVEEDALTRWEIIGHFRYPKPK